MTEPGNETILLVCDCESSATRILDKLYHGGFGVVGPAPNASMAMAMAAQAAPTIALVATSPNGRRNAAELASDLMNTWGVRSWILERAGGGQQVGEVSWRAHEDRVTYLQRALQGAENEGRTA